MTCLMLALTLMLPAEETWGQLRERYSRLRTLSGEFEETLIPGFDTTQQRFLGNFYLRLPGSFRIEVKFPYKQTIVGDESTLWIYFPEEKRALRQAGNGPVPFLAFFHLLQDPSVDVQVSKDSAGFTQLYVSDSTGSASFSNFTLTLDKTGTRIVRFSFADGWGNRYAFKFFRQQWDAKIPSHFFRFIPPRGTRVDTLGFQ